MRWTVLVLACLATGCATVGDIDKREPQFTVTTQKSGGEVARCVSAAWRNRKAAVEERQARDATILVATFFFYGPTVVATAEIVDRGDETTLSVRSTGKPSDRKFARSASSCV
jgi:hypothetical protein